MSNHKSEKIPDVAAAAPNNKNRVILKAKRTCVFMADETPPGGDQVPSPVPNVNKAEPQPTTKEAKARYWKGCVAFSRLLFLAKQPSDASVADEAAVELQKLHESAYPDFKWNPVCYMAGYLSPPPLDAKETGALALPRDLALWNVKFPRQSVTFCLRYLDVIVTESGEVETVDDLSKLVLAALDSEQYKNCKKCEFDPKCTCEPVAMYINGLRIKPHVFGWCRLPIARAVVAWPSRPIVQTAAGANSLSSSFQKLAIAGGK
jgi:hypothetical protein